MKICSLPAAVFILSFNISSTVQAQLTDLEKNTLVEFWSRNSRFSNISGDAKQKVLDNPENTNDLRICATKARQLEAINQVINLGVIDFDKTFEKISANFPPE